jgi:hypothetical protein
MINFEAIKYYDQFEMKEYMISSPIEKKEFNNLNGTTSKKNLLIVSVILFIFINWIEIAKTIKNDNFENIFNFDDLRSFPEEDFSSAVIEDLKKGL